MGGGDLLWGKVGRGFAFVTSKKVGQVKLVLGWSMRSRCEVVKSIDVKQHLQAESN